MALYHSSDWHLSFLEDGTIQKPMHDRSWSVGTKHYQNYLERIKEEGALLNKDDVLCITGDITHEVGMTKVLSSLMWIYDAIPCHIVLIRGNHDQRLKRQKMNDLLASSGLWHRMCFLWEGETSTERGYTFHCVSDHSNETARMFPVDDTAHKNADVFLCHYPVPESTAIEIGEAYTKAKAYLSGHIHCTSNNPEISKDGIAPQWYYKEAAPTDGKTFGNCFFSTGTTDVRDWKDGKLLRKILD